MNNWLKSAKHLKLCFALGLTLAFIATPLLSLAASAAAPPAPASSSDAILGAQDGRRDAARDTSIGWYAAGFCCGCIGSVVTYCLPAPEVPSAPLVGKSPEYVTAYSAAYHSAARQDRDNDALYGCLAGAVIGLILDAASL